MFSFFSRVSELNNWKIINFDSAQIPNKKTNSDLLWLQQKVTGEIVHCLKSLFYSHSFTALQKSEGSFSRFAT